MFSFPLVGDFPLPSFRRRRRRATRDRERAVVPRGWKEEKGGTGGKPFSHGMGEERGGEKWRGEKRFPLITQCTAAYMKYIL